MLIVYAERIQGQKDELTVVLPCPAPTKVAAAAGLLTQKNLLAVNDLSRAMVGIARVEQPATT